MELGTVHDRWSQQNIDRFYAEGQWRRETLIDHAAQQAREQPDKVFATDGTSLTCGELHDSAVRLAGQEVPSLADISRFLLDRGLAVQKVPERLEIVDALPMTATGKIQKHVLRRQVADVLASEAG